MICIRVRTRFVTAFACAVLLSATISASAAPVTVTVNVATSAGIPIVNAPIQVYSDAAVVFGFTDVAGIVMFTIELDPSDPDIVARLWNGAFHLNLSPEERELAYEQFEQLPELYHFLPYYFAQAVPDQTQYQINMIAQPAVQVTGRLVDNQGLPLAGNFFAIGVRDSAWFGEFFDANGVFTARGISQGAGAEIALVLKGPETQLIQLSAVQTMQDIALGDIVVQLHERPIPLNMSITNFEDLYDPGDIALWTMISLIRDDAQVLLTFPVKPPDGQVVAEVVAIQTDVPRTTEGVYYIVPGPIAAPTALALLDAIRAGQLAALDAAGVPKFTAVAGQTTQFTFDATLARNAILAATGQAP